MVPLHTVFGALLILFGLIGGLRGWAKELIVAFSVFLALFVQHVLLTFLPPLSSLFCNLAVDSQFYTRAVIFILITVFGYASPTIVSKIGARVARERLQDILLGFFIGLLNGFLIVGTMVAFLDMSFYGVPDDQRDTVRKVDENGQPVTEYGCPAMVVDRYHDGATGIGGITPPAPGTTSHNLLAFLPPMIIQRSDAVLYLAVAAAFVFVIVVFL
jgi:uncharacterized membrane protein required for colicin V production